MSKSVSRIAIFVVSLAVVGALSGPSVVPSSALPLAPQGVTFQQRLSRPRRLQLRCRLYRRTGPPSLTLGKLHLSLSSLVVS